MSAPLDRTVAPDRSFAQAGSLGEALTIAMALLFGRARPFAKGKLASMPIELRMPALSPTMEEGTLAKWLVKEGDAVKSGDILAEIETDKATMEFEAVDEGTIAKIVVPEGSEGVKVNAPIAVLLEEGEKADAVVDIAAAMKDIKAAVQAEVPLT